MNSVGTLQVVTSAQKGTSIQSKPFTDCHSVDTVFSISFKAKVKPIFTSVASISGTMCTLTYHRLFLHPASKETDHNRYRKKIGHLA